MEFSSVDDVAKASTLLKDLGPDIAFVTLEKDGILDQIHITPLYLSRGTIIIEVIIQIVQGEID
jgi:hypothetical protein